jgi:hypothetical protein
MNWPEKADDLGRRMAAMIIERGHDDEGTEISLDYFEQGLEQLLEDHGAPDADELTAAAVATARREIKRRRLN